MPTVSDGWGYTLAAVFLSCWTLGLGMFMTDIANPIQRSLHKQPAHCFCFWGDYHKPPVLQDIFRRELVDIRTTAPLDQAPTVTLTKPPLPVLYGAILSRLL